jgi:hypothetical protein
MIFESLDFLYVPAPDIESSIHYYTEVLGGRLVWKIHAFGVWVACIKLSENNGKPYVLLADHISKKDLMLIYRVLDLEATASRLDLKDGKKKKELKFLQGLAASFETLQIMLL